MLRNSVYLLVSSMLSVSSAAFAQSCNDTGAQVSCHATCDLQCSEQQFMLANLAYCAAAASRSDPVDGPDCPLNAASTAVEAVAGAMVDGCSDPDASPEVIFACVVARQNQGTPECSQRPGDLIPRSAQLNTRIEAELGTYSELLAREWDFENREALCTGYTPADLGAAYSRVTGERNGLRTFMAALGELRSCRDEWIAWEQAAQQLRLRDGTRPGAPTGTVDTLIGELQATFAPLNDSLENVNSALITLENSEPKIAEIIGFYSRWCIN